VTDVIKYLKLLIVQLESLPVLLGCSCFKEALWTRAVNFHVSHSLTPTLNRYPLQTTHEKLQISTLKHDCVNTEVLLYSYTVTVTS